MPHRNQVIMLERATQEVQQLTQATRQVLWHYARTSVSMLTLIEGFGANLMATGDQLDADNLEHMLRGLAEARRMTEQLADALGELTPSA